MIRCILIALDDTPRAAHVLAVGADLADRLGAAVHLFRAVAVPPEIPPAGHQEPHVELETLVARRTIDELARMARDVPNVTIEPPYVGGASPWQAIIEAARRVDADLVVLGSHGFAGWDRLLGTTAGHVADRADRHVLVVHDR